MQAPQGVCIFFGAPLWLVMLLKNYILTASNLQTFQLQIICILSRQSRKTFKYHKAKRRFAG